MSNKRSIRATNRVSVGNSNSGRVQRVAKRKQGGAWVPVYVIQLDANEAIRRVRGDLVRLAV